MHSSMQLQYNAPLLAYFLHVTTTLILGHLTSEAYHSPHDSTATYQRYLKYIKQHKFYLPPPYIRIKTPELITKRCHIVTINEFQMKCKSIHGSFCTSASLMHTHFCSFQYTIIYYVNNFYQLLMRRQSSRCNDDRITRISMRPIHRLHQV